MRDSEVAARPPAAVRVVDPAAEGALDHHLLRAAEGGDVALGATQYAALMGMVQRSSSVPSDALPRVRGVWERALAAGLPPSAPLLRPLVASCVAAGRRDEALDRLTAAHEAGQPLDDASFEPLVVGCVKHGDENGLRAAVGLLRQQRPAPGAALYGALIDAHRESGALSRAHGVCSHALSRGVLPAAAPLRALLVALAHAGRSGDAL